MSFPIKKKLGVTMPSNKVRDENSKKKLNENQN